MDMEIATSEISEIWKSLKDLAVVPSERQLVALGGCAFGTYLTWKALRALSRCGNSENEFLLRAHRVVRKLMNCGIIMRMTDFHSAKNVTICNYGSYGCCPKEVISYRNALYNISEECTDDWYRHVALDRWEEAVCTIAKAVGASSENLVLIRNVTESIHCVLVWLNLKENDGVLMSNLTYSAIQKAVKYHCERAGAKFYQAEFVFPIESEDDIVAYYEDQLRKHEKIRLVVFDHITSASAVRLPVERLVMLCHKYGKIAFIDGAHGPGQVPLDLENLGTDFYAGNLYKWYYSPRSAGFLWVKPEFQENFHPTLVSHNCDKGFQKRFFTQGVTDHSTSLASAYAVGTYYPSIGGMEHLYWYCIPLLEWAVNLMTEMWGTKRLEIPESAKAPFMAVIRLPPVYQRFYSQDEVGAARFIRDFLATDHVIVMSVVVQGELMVRVSTQLHARKRDYYKAAVAVKKRAEELEAISTGQ